MHAAWHFRYAVSFGGESSLREVGLGGIHPLTQHYASLKLIYKIHKDICLFCTNDVIPQVTIVT
ncbi:TPA: DUF3265 domain-containing protein [Vibrio vulnificus]|nr:DUF3265 domain-containing protein [Vibrio vulnificus]HAS6159151.1 DUF3265 domain-containing protein [Vibrio vulnificus]